MYITVVKQLLITILALFARQYWPLLADTGLSPVRLLSYPLLPLAHFDTTSRLHSQKIKVSTKPLTTEEEGGIVAACATMTIPHERR
jgi:hypothetical protein